MGRAENPSVIQIKVSHRKPPPPLPPELVEQTDFHVSPKFVLGFCRQCGPIHGHDGFSPVSGELVSQYKIQKLLGPSAASLVHRNFTRLSPVAGRTLPSRVPPRGMASGSRATAPRRLPAPGCPLLPSCPVPLVGAGGGHSAVACCPVGSVPRGQGQLRLCHLGVEGNFVHGTFYTGKKSVVPEASPI